MQCGKRKGGATSGWLWEPRGSLPGKLPEASGSEVQMKWLHSSGWQGRCGGHSGCRDVPAEQRGDVLKQAGNTGKHTWCGSAGG